MDFRIVLYCHSEYHWNGPDSLNGPDAKRQRRAVIPAPAIGRGSLSNMRNRRAESPRYRFSEIVALRELGQDRTSAHAPEAESLGAEFWKSARVAMPPGKTSVHLHLDSDVVEWFRAHGKGHLTRMNAVLRAYVEAQK
jgi:uncharacterized protein (DUF4415 family)